MGTFLFFYLQQVVLILLQSNDYTPLQNSTVKQTSFSSYVAFQNNLAELLPYKD